MAKQKTIIFDLDDTLINTSLIRSEIVKLAQKLGVSKKKALNARTRVRSSSKPFTIDNYASYLFPKNSKEKVRLKKDFEKMFGAKGTFNYPGVEGFLKKLAKKYRLILLTYGNPALQQKKIAQSGLAPLFENIIVTSDNTKMQAVKYLVKHYTSDMLFIDNVKSTCDAACMLGLSMIWVTSKNKKTDYYNRLTKRIETKLKK